MLMMMVMMCTILDLKKILVLGVGMLWSIIYCGNVSIHDKRKSKTEQIRVPLSGLKKLKNNSI